MRMLIGVVGMNGSGKEEFGKYLSENYGFSHKDIGQEVRNEIKALGRNYLAREEMDAMGNGRRKLFGPDYWCRKAVESIESNKIVITSLRNRFEVEYLLAQGGVVVEVYADLETRFKRTLYRVKADPNRHGDVSSLEYFKEREEENLRSKDPSKMQVLECITMATYRINNNGSIDELHEQTDRLLEQLKSPQD